MADAANKKNGPARVKRAPSQDRDAAVIPRELIAHQVAGNLALDFCNTAGEHLATKPDELLLSWESFLRWGAQVGLIGWDSYFELLKHPEPLDGIIELREAIYRVGLAVVGSRSLSEVDVDLLRERANAGRPEIEFSEVGGQWRPTPGLASEQLCALLGAEALSLFCSPNARRIGMCDGGNCGWLFLDESRGKRRRWCDMSDCGGRAKARRFYEKHK